MQHPHHVCRAIADIHHADAMKSSQGRMHFLQKSELVSWQSASAGGDIDQDRRADMPGEDLGSMLAEDL